MGGFSRWPVSPVQDPILGSYDRRCPPSGLCTSALCMIHWFLPLRTFCGAVPRQAPHGAVLVLAELCGHTTWDFPVATAKEGHCGLGHGGTAYSSACSVLLLTPSALLSLFMWGFFFQSGFWARLYLEVCFRILHLLHFFSSCCFVFYIEFCVSISVFPSF